MSMSYIVSSLLQYILYTIQTFKNTAYMSYILRISYIINLLK